MTNILIKTTPCVVCEKVLTFWLDEAKVKRWVDGELIQNVFPELDSVEREALVSGVCSQKCWDEL